MADPNALTPDIPIAGSTPPDLNGGYSTLANIAQPRMMGDYPIGNGAGAAIDYRQQQDRYNNLLQKATSLADLQAKMKASQAEEYSRGAPGRAANIDTDVALAQGRQGTLPSMLSAQSDTAQAGATSAYNSKVEEAKRTLAPYANKSVQKDSNIDDIIDEMKGDGVTKIGNKNLDDIPKEQLKRMLSASRESMVNTPTQAGKEQLENMKDQTWLSREDIRAKARIGAAQIAAQVHAEVAKMSQANRPPDPNRVIFDRIKDEYGLPAASEWYNATVNAQAYARAGAQPQRLDFNPGALGPDSPVTPRPIAVPKAPAVPPLNNPQPQLPPSAATPPVAQPANPGRGPQPLPKDQALKIWEGIKGTPQAAQARIYFKATYGEDPPQ